MLQAFVITLREGLEAFLIVAISLAYLRKAGRAELARAVNWGIAVAIAISAGGGYLLFRAVNQEWLEGPLAIIAAVSVATLTVHMWRAGRRIKGEIEGRLQTSTMRGGAAAFAGVFLFTLFMVSREGIETVLLLMQLHETMNLVIGAVIGIAGAAFVSWLWSRYGHRVPLGLFFQTTAIFLFVFVVQLLIQGVHEMSEQNFLPYSTIIHESTEAWGPDSQFGHFLTYMLVVAPATWLLLRGVFSGSARPPRGSSGAIATGSPKGLAPNSSSR